jgi:putative addiction module component (TIGR02574 family)
MSSIAKADILSLSVTERILLVEDIWDSIAEVPEEVPLTATQKEELDHRLDAYHCDPLSGSPWPEVRERILRRA